MQRQRITAVVLAYVGDSRKRTFLLVLFFTRNTARCILGTKLAQGFFIKHRNMVYINKQDIQTEL